MGGTISKTYDISTSWTRCIYAHSGLQIKRYFYILCGVGSSSLSDPTTANFSIRNVKIETGNKATDWTPAPEDVEAKVSALDYLKDALTDGSTEIAGGLTMTNVLMLKNLDGEVTAGMSGLTRKAHNNTVLPDNVLAWGGGTYVDAFLAALSKDYLKEDGTPITTLLKKDGTGKIGVFKISDTQVVVDVPNKGMVIIDASTSNGGIFIKDTDGIDKAIISPKSISEVSVNNQMTSSLYSYSGGAIYTFSGNNPANKSLRSISNQKQGSNALTYAVSAGVTIVMSVGQVYSSYSYRLHVGLLVNYKNAYGINLSTTIASAYVNLAYGELNSAYNKTLTKTLVLTSNSSSTISGTITGISLQAEVLELSSNPDDDAMPAQDIVINRMAFNSSTSISITNVLTLTTNPHTIIAKDGLLSYYNQNKFFKVQNTDTGQKIYAKGLSTAKGTAGSGELYVSQSFINAFKDFLTYFKNEWVPDVRSVGSNAEKANNMINKANSVLNMINDTSLIANS